MRQAYIIKTFLGPVSVLGIPKCGTQTLEKYKSGMITESKTQQFPLRIAFIRDPFDRWLSAFFFMATTGYKITRNKISSYEQFVDEALLSNDEHLAPQSRILNGSLVNKLMRLDSMSDVLGKLIGLPVSVENSTHREDIDTSYRKAEVMERYREDVKLYSDALNSKAV